MSEKTLRARGSRAAHLYKAMFRQHHRDLAPLLRRLIPKDAVVFDVGGHAGQFTKLFARIAKTGTVYSFEPASYARAILTTVVRLRRLHNVRVVTAGLGATPGKLVLQTPVKPGGAMRFGLAHFGDTNRAEPLKREEVTVTTIDAFCAEYAVRPSFIKADIEGWEMRMLEGAAKIIAEAKPVLMLEVVDSHLRRAGDDRATLFARLAEAGYERFRLDDVAPQMADQDDGDANYLFIANDDPRRDALGL